VSLPSQATCGHAKRHAPIRWWP